jgi:hypothetical protein
MKNHSAGYRTTERVVRNLNNNKETAKDERKTPPLQA